MAELKYKEAMENFDQIMELAASEPGRMAAAEEEMARGFTLPNE
jgi:hypothetical protein